MQDRMAEVKKLAQTLLPVVVSSCGYDTVASHVDQLRLKPAAHAGMMAMIDRVRAPQARFFFLKLSIVNFTDESLYIGKPVCVYHTHRLCGGECKASSSPCACGPTYC